MFLSWQTYEGFNNTVHSAIECTKFLLQKGMEFVLTECFCQDPVEEYFGNERKLMGGAVIIQASTSLVAMPIPSNPGLCHVRVVTEGEGWIKNGMGTSNRSQTTMQKKKENSIIDSINSMLFISFPFK